MLALPGSAYLYQGEELGLPEVFDLPVEVLDDPVWEKSGHTLKGRDGSRVPIPWTRGGGSFGFGDDGAWLPQPEGWGELSVETQTNVEGSSLEFYRNALQVRQQILGDGTLEWLDLGPSVLAFRRGSGTTVLNFGPDPVAIPAGEVLISSSELAGGLLPPDATVWIMSH
jgi:alpha-glucosidase